MKKNLFSTFAGLAYCAISGVALGVPVGVSDDFESYTTGQIPPTNAWDVLTVVAPDGEPPLDPPSDQTELYTVEAGIGQDGGQGLALDVNTAFHLYNTVRSVAAEGTGVIIQADFQIATSGVALNNIVVDPNDENVILSGSSGVNDPIIGIQLSSVATAAGGAKTGFNFCRRADDFWGVTVPGAPFLAGFVNNSAIGLSSGLTASSSDFFTLKVFGEVKESTFTEDGMEKTETRWVVFATVSPQGAVVPVLTTTEIVLRDTDFPIDQPIYGGLSTGFNNNADERMTPIASISKVTAVATDNFSAFGFSTVTDVDDDGLNEFEEVKLGTSDMDRDSDDDGFTDNEEVLGSSNPLVNTSIPKLTGVIFDFNFTAEEEFVDGGLGGQNGFLGQNTPIDVTAGTVSDSTAFFRNIHGDGALGSTGGNPRTATELFAQDDVLRIAFDYQFTLGSNSNTTFATVGIRESSVGNVIAQEGFRITYSSFENPDVVSVGGSVRFFPNVNAATDPADGLLIDGSAFGLNPVGEPSLGDGTVDFESDRMRIEYVAKIDVGIDEFDFAFVNMTPTRFRITNLDTNITYDYVNDRDGDPSTPEDGAGITFTTVSLKVVNAITEDDIEVVSVDDPWSDMFYSQQLAATGIAGSLGTTSRVSYQYAKVATDLDSDTLTAVDELLRGTLDAVRDTDKDGVDDVIEVADGTDPLDPASNLGSDPVVSSIGFIDADTIQIQFTGEASTGYVLASSPDLTTAFQATTSTTTTDASGAGALSIDVATPLTRGFFRVELPAAAQQ